MDQIRLPMGLAQCRCRCHLRDHGGGAARHGLEPAGWLCRAGIDRAAGLCRHRGLYTGGAGRRPARQHSRQCCQDARRKRDEANGLAFEEALATVTIDAARIIGVDDRVGSLQPGRDGDVAIFDGDPFEYTTHCIATVIEGEVVSEGERRREEREREL